MSVGTALAAETADSASVYLDKISFVAPETAKDGRKVTLSMDIVLDSARIHNQHTLALTPCIVSADSSESLAFGTVYVDGRTRHLAHGRRDSLGKPDSARLAAEAVIARRNGREQTYVYVSSVPYSRWMLDGRIEVRECVTGCVDCMVGESVRTLAYPVLPAFVPEWRMRGIEPEAEPIKHRAETRIARLHFVQDGSVIVPEMGDNRSMLDTVSNSIDLVNKQEYISIKDIFVAGYASLEGTYEYNMRLSSIRARALADYIAEHTGVSSDKVSVEWGGEDWECLRRILLEEPDRPKRDTILSLMDSLADDRNACERAIRSLLTPQEYRWLTDTVYPLMRYCSYRIEYEVRNFTLDEARRIIRERPQDLNLSEIYRVAASYDPSSPEHRYALDMAARYYPDSPAVRGDMALRAMESGDPASAVQLLEDFASEAQPELLNILGVACAEAGLYDRAREVLIEAVAAGDWDAEHNFAQLLGVMDQL